MLVLFYKSFLLFISIKLYLLIVFIIIFLELTSRIQKVVYISNENSATITNQRDCGAKKIHRIMEFRTIQHPIITNKPPLPLINYNGFCLSIAAKEAA